MRLGGTACVWDVSVPDGMTPVHLELGGVAEETVVAAHQQTAHDGRLCSHIFFIRGHYSMVRRGGAFE